MSFSLCNFDMETNKTKIGTSQKKKVMAYLRWPFIFFNSLWNGMRACITTLCLLLPCPHLFESLFHVFIFCISVDFLIFFFLPLSFVLCYFAAVYIFFPNTIFFSLVILSIVFIYMRVDNSPSSAFDLLWNTKFKTPFRETDF